MTEIMGSRVSLGIGSRTDAEYRVRLARGKTNGCVNVFVDDEIFATFYTDGTARYWKAPKEVATIDWLARVQ